MRFPSLSPSLSLSLSPPSARVPTEALTSAPPTHPGSEFTLPDVLPPSFAQSLLSTLPASSLTHLSSFLPSPSPSAHLLPTSTPAESRASLSRAVRSPEFRRALAGLDRALRTGATGPLVAGLGMRPRAAMGTGEFLEEVMRGAEAEREKEREGEGEGEREGGQGGEEGAA